VRAAEAAIAIPVSVEDRAGECEWVGKTSREARGESLDVDPDGNCCVQQMRPTVRDMP
jgi:hypothetical protein